MKEFETFTETVLSNDRWAMRLGKLQKRKEGNKDVFEQKRVDVLLSVDMVRHAAAGHIQHAVLISPEIVILSQLLKLLKSLVLLFPFGVVTTIQFITISLLLADEVHQLDWKYFPRFVPDEPVRSEEEKEDRVQA